MNREAIAIVAGYHFFIDKERRSSNKLICKVNESAITSLLTPKSFKIHQKLTPFLLQSVANVVSLLEQKNLLPAPDRRGVIMNVPNAIFAEIDSYLYAFHQQRRRIRPHQSLSIDSSSPTALVTLQFDFKGPSATLTDLYGGLSSLGWAYNLIRENRADLMMVVDVDRELSSTDDFVGSITVAALMKESALGEVEPVGKLTDWAFEHPGKDSLQGRKLEQVMTWLDSSNSPQRFGYEDKENWAICFTKS
nr:beta-ketoacyl synthase N-terminal-like domain-containing protein [Brevibacillus laterosporus]